MWNRILNESVTHLCQGNISFFFLALMVRGPSCLFHLTFSSNIYSFISITKNIVLVNNIIHDILLTITNLLYVSVQYTSDDMMHELRLVLPKISFCLPTCYLPSDSFPESLWDWIFNTQPTAFFHAWSKIKWRAFLAHAPKHTLKHWHHLRQRQEAGGSFQGCVSQLLNHKLFISGEKCEKRLCSQCSYLISSGFPGNFCVQ